MEDIVMDDKKKNRTEVVNFRLTQKELTDLQQKWQKTNCRKLSDYIRKIIFGKPIISHYRNRSLDDLMEEAMVLRKELNAIGVNFNQAVHRLHTLDHLPQMERWLVSFEGDKHRLFGKIDEIVLQVEKIAVVWLQ
jgi:hypothetical protein